MEIGEYHVMSPLFHDHQLYFVGNCVFGEE